MGDELKLPQFDLLKKQVDEIKDLIEEGLKTPLLVSEPKEKSVKPSSEQNLNTIDTNQDLSEAKIQLAETRKENEKLKYQLSHVLRACANKDNTISRLQKDLKSS